jgi:hypothetical protein
VPCHPERITCRRIKQPQGTVPPIRCCHDMHPCSP